MTYALLKNIETNHVRLQSPAAINRLAGNPPAAKDVQEHGRPASAEPS
jgi:hypothetical protein